MVIRVREEVYSQLTKVQCTYNNITKDMIRQKESPHYLLGSLVIFLF